MLQSPNSGAAHGALGLAYNQRGQLEEAIRHYTRAIEFTPEDFEAYNDLGVALAVQGKLDEAVSAWEKVLEIDAANQGARDNIPKARKELEKSNHPKPW